VAQALHPDYPRLPEAKRRCLGRHRLKQWMAVIRESLWEPFRFPI